MAEAGVIEIPVRPDVRDFGRDLGRQLGREINAARADVSKGMDRLADAGRTAFGAVTQGALLLGAAGAAAVAGFGASIVGAAVDLDRIQSKSKVVFGASAGFVEEWAATNARSLMLTRGEAQQVATTLGDLLIPMGFLPEAAAKIATEATATAAALARWDSQSRGVGNAQDALADALLGEFERLKEYGVVLDATTLDELVRAQGLDHLEGAARRQAEAEIIMTEVNRQSAAAITSLSDAELTLGDRIDLAKLSVASFRDEMAMRLLPKLQEWLDWLNANADNIELYLTKGMMAAEAFIRDDLIPAFNIMRDWWTGPDGQAFRDAVASIFTGVKEDAEGAETSVSDFATSVTQLADSATQAIEFGDQVAGALNRVNTTLSADSGPTLNDFVRLTAQAWVDIVAATIDGTVRALGAVSGFLGELVARTLRGFAEFVRIVAESAREWVRVMAQGAIDAIGAVANGLGRIVGDTMRWGADFVGVVFSTAREWVRVLAQGAIDAIGAVANGLGRIVGETMRWAADFVRIVIDAAAGWLRAVTDGGAQVVGYFQALPGRIAGAVGDLGRTLYDKGRQLITGFIDGIKAAASGIGSAIGGAISGAIGGIGDGYGDAAPMGVGGVLRPGAGYQAQMNAIRRAFPGTQLISGYRPGAVTATGNPSYHGKGRAVDIPPSMALFNWIRENYGGITKELIFSPAGPRQVHNGRPHMYTGVTRSNHFDHVHWALEKGAVFDRPTVLDRTLVAETPRARPELVTPQRLMAETFSDVLDRRGTAGPLMSVGQLTVRERVDIDALVDRLSARVAAGRL